MRMRLNQKSYLKRALSPTGTVNSIFHIEPPKVPYTWGIIWCGIHEGITYIYSLLSYLSVSRSQCQESGEIRVQSSSTNEPLETMSRLFLSTLLSPLLCLHLRYLLQQDYLVRFTVNTIFVRRYLYFWILRCETLKLQNSLRTL